MATQTKMMSDAEKDALCKRIDRALAALGKEGVPALIADYARPSAADGATLQQLCDDLELEARLKRTFDDEKYQSTMTVAGKGALHIRALCLTEGELFSRGYRPESGITSAEYDRVRKKHIKAITGKVEMPPPVTVVRAPTEEEIRSYIEAHNLLPKSTPKPRRKKPAKTARVLTEKQQADFAEFWREYPKKRNKGDAEKAWKKLAPDAELRKRIMQAIARQKKSLDWIKEKGQFVPYPSKWLNVRGWEDETPGAGKPDPLGDAVEYVPMKKAAGG